MPVETASQQRARWAVLAMFFANGALLANWLARIPRIQANLAMRFGGANLVRAGGACAAAGLLLAILLPQAAPVLLGFAGVGAGLSIVVPMAFSAAGNVPNLPSGVGIAGVATIGYAGFLAGPPAIGLVAEASTLRLAMLLVLLLVSSLIFTSRALQMKA